MNILFITHDASRSGAPLVLLYLMRWLKKNKPDIKMDILFVRGGVLEPDFEALCENSFHYLKTNTTKNTNTFRKVLNKVVDRLSDKSVSNKKLFYKKVAGQNYDLVYANSVVSLPSAYVIKKESRKSKLLVHVHELQTIILTLIPKFKNYLPEVDSFIAVSEQVKDNLISNWQISESIIRLVYECAVINPQIIDQKHHTFTVGASGLSYWRKGNDVFLQVARYVVKHYPVLNIEFIWVGNEFKDKPIILADIEKLGLKGKVNFVGEVEDPSNYFNQFDVFLMLSREDPFPLVCIELARLKKPIVCFENGSGTAEVISNGGGYVVPYLDIEAVAEKIVFYYNNPKTLNKDGEQAHALFEDFTPEKICPQLYKVMDETVN